MAQIVTIPMPMAGITLRPPGKPKLSDDDYWAFCMANPDLRVERSAEGEIVIMPPAGGESDFRSSEVIFELKGWAIQDRRGQSFGSSVQFFLPDGSGLSPDAAWVSNATLSPLSRQERKKFLRAVPEFVIEILSPSDSLKAAKAKMEQWIANGVELAWLIDGDAETIYVYRQGHAARTRRHVKQIAGEGPVAGFVLELSRIWKGL